MQRRIGGMICHVCQRPALTMDEARVPYCSRHALMRGGIVRLASARHDALDDSNGVLHGGFERSAAASG